jgi:hypothetical protein
MIIKITSYDVHVRRSYFNRQNSQLFNQRIPYGQREIQYYRVFFAQITQNNLYESGPEPRAHML